MEVYWGIRIKLHSFYISAADKSQRWLHASTTLLLGKETGSGEQILRNNSIY
jgi:hypothetical protein